MQRRARLSLVNSLRIRFGIILVLLLLAAVLAFANGSQVQGLRQILLARSQQMATTADSQWRLETDEVFQAYERQLDWYRVLGTWGPLLICGLGLLLVFRLPQVNELIDSVKSSISHLGTATNDIFSICIEQLHNATDQAAAVQQATTTSEEIAASAKQITESASQVEKVAANTMEACNAGAKTVGRTIEGMHQIKNHVQQMAQAMSELGKDNQKIGGIVEIIDEISDQTTLLALNAAIEAAGAGEYGRRFAVVAVEVRRLAERTVEATKQIRELIEGMQDRTNSTILATEEGIGAVDAGFESVQEVGNAFKELLSLVAKTNGAAKEIHISTSQQTQASEQLADTIGNVKEVVDKVLEGAKETQSSIAALNDLSDQLVRLVGDSDPNGHGEAEKA